MMHPAPNGRNPWAKLGNGANSQWYRTNGIDQLSLCEVRLHAHRRSRHGSHALRTRIPRACRRRNPRVCLPCALPHRLDGMAGSCGSRIRTCRNSRKPPHHVRAAGRCLPACGGSSRTPTQQAVRGWQGAHPTSHPALRCRRNRRLPLRLCLSRHHRRRLHPAVGQRHPP